MTIPLLEITPISQNQRVDNLVNPRYGDDWRDRASLRSLEGRSFYQFGRTMEPNKEAIRQAIPDIFLTMAQSISPNEVNYQRTRDRVLSQVKTMQIPDMTCGGNSINTVKPVETALPYRYSPAANPPA